MIQLAVAGRVTAVPGVDVLAGDSSSVGYRDLLLNCGKRPDGPLLALGTSVVNGPGEILRQCPDVAEAQL